MVVRLQVPQHILDETRALQQSLEGESTKEIDGVSLKAPRRNSEISIADMLISCLSQVTPVVSTQQALWYYDAQTGIWAPYDQDYILSIIDGFDGLRMGKSKKSEIRLTEQKTRGIYTAALRHRSILDKNFFDKPTPGVQCANGFVQIIPADEHSLSEIVLRPSSSEFRSRFALDIEYKPNVDIRLWSRYINNLFYGDDDAQEKSQLLASFFGLCLIGQSTQFARALILLGAGANGKSTFLDYMTSLYPPYGRTAVPPYQWSKEYYLGALQHSLLNACNEMPTSEIVGTDVFKALITGESITARQPYGRPFNFIPQAGHVFACNELPYINDHSEGFWRRFLIVEFNRNFLGEGKTKEDVIRSLQKHREKTLVWALRGAKSALDDGGYSIPSSHTNSTQKWRLRANPVAYWVDLCNFTFDEKGLSARELYLSFKKWSEENGYKTISASTFGERMGGLGFPKCRRSSGYVFLCSTQKERKGKKE